FLLVIWHRMFRKRMSLQVVPGLLVDLFAKNMLIPKEQYKDFINNNSRITKESIKVFADLIGRDPGIVLGRLLYDKIIPYTEAKTFEELRYKYRITN
ncbi:MAG: hypothetical protein SPL03_08645, partial [Succinivibrio dextrinosolvens]|nr:hypothetical protein [Succinivibrio dextrinosolvens]